MCTCLTCWEAAPRKAGGGAEQLLGRAGRVSLGGSLPARGRGEAEGVGIPWSPLLPPVQSGQPLAVLNALGNSWRRSPSSPRGVTLAGVLKLEFSVKLISGSCCR